MSSWVSSPSATKNSVTPGFSAITTWPRTGLTDRSGTKSRAPAPVQLTITGAVACRTTWASESSGAAVSWPPARRSRPARYSR